jgi:hypothetical protein
MARNGDGLFLRNGYWAFKYPDGVGRWPEKSTGLKNQSQAFMAKARFLQALKDGSLPEDMATWTLKQAAEHWCAIRSVHNAATLALSQSPVSDGGRLLPL